MEVLVFIFQDFWHFVGSAILLAITVSPVTALVAKLGAR